MSRRGCATGYILNKGPSKSRALCPGGGIRSELIVVTLMIMTLDVAEALRNDKTQTKSCIPDFGDFDNLVRGAMATVAWLIKVKGQSIWHSLVAPELFKKCGGGGIRDCEPDVMGLGPTQGPGSG